MSRCSVFRADWCTFGCCVQNWGCLSRYATIVDDAAYQDGDFDPAADGDTVHRFGTAANAGSNAAGDYMTMSASSSAMVLGPAYADVIDTPTRSESAI